MISKFYGVFLDASFLLVSSLLSFHLVDWNETITDNNNNNKHSLLIG